ncbi:potassium/proton antiporter [Neptunitalea lumnitzerae]|uniref:K+/H+ antiporter n=1 Tax=Neptunitalea lumnitzerae TaxID=2965509 RepID=A0ABQ5MHW6_9FLAO|nr:potassium/proton antiporter [Neptunitalea sp. Y10]GLB48896.1 K+/H+ antiporter [Neptunitalea sp. Y10]
MTLSIENILLVGSVLLLVSIIAGKTSYRFGVPVLVFFLLIGMVAGSEGIGGIHFDNPVLARFVGVVAFNFILFSGGLETRWTSIKPVMWQGVTLSTLGVLITAGTVGVFVHYITPLAIYESLLVGAIISSTDAAAVFSILRSKNIALKDNLRPTLELESGSNDPMANVLTIVLINLITTPDKSFAEILPFFFGQLIIGALAGFGFGYLNVKAINKIKPDFEGLYPILIMALMFITYSVTDAVGGNGFLAVYLSAVFIGNKTIVRKKTIIKAFDGYAWLMQIILFLTLGLLVFPSRIPPVIHVGLFISAFLIFIARPLSVFISLAFFKVKFKNMLFISWVGLRGASPIVFATYALVAKVDRSDIIFNIVFFISLTSVLIQGTSLSAVSKWLKVALPQNQKVRTPVDIELSENVDTELVEISIDENNPVIGKAVTNIQLPKTSLIVMIQRNGKYFTPNGTTVIEKEDKLMIMAPSEKDLQAVFKVLDV